MQNIELNKMLDEDNDTRRFNAWGTEAVPYFSSLTDEEKDTLKHDYIEAEKWKKTHQDVMNNAISRIGGDIDYSTDVEKTRVLQERSSNNLTVTLNSLSEKYGNDIKK